MERHAAAWRTYGYWALWVGVAFFGVYPACNWITARRASSFSLYHPAELAIPFVPALVWVYLSMYALFLAPPFFMRPAALKALGRQLVWATWACGAVYLLLPARLGFPRVTPPDAAQAKAFAALFSLDLPHNLAPSMHVVYSALISLAAADGAPGFKAFFWAWLAALCASTVLVHQHHLLDVAFGLALAAYFRGRIKTEDPHGQDRAVDAIAVVGDAARARR